MEQLRKYLSGQFPISTLAWEELKKVITEIEFKKKEFYLESGKVCNRLGIVKKGIFSCYQMTSEGERKVFYFNFQSKNPIVVDLASFVSGAESNVNIQAIENSTLYCINKSDLYTLYDKYTSLCQLGRVLMESQYLESLNRINMLMDLKISERYQTLQNDYPEIIKKITATDIASYLGTDKYTLSKVKAELLNKKR